MNRAFGPDRRRMHRADRRKRLGAFERQHRDIRGALVEHRHVHGTSVAPQPEQGPMALGQLLAGEVPAIRPHNQARPRAVARDSLAIDGVGDRHGYPSSLATFWNQATRTAGMSMPATSTMPRRANSGTEEAFDLAGGPRGSPNAMLLRRRKRPARPIRIANTSTIASQGWRAKVEVTTKNSLMKMPSGGRPAMATTPSTSPQPSTGLVTVRPPISAICWVPLTCAI